MSGNYACSSTQNAQYSTPTLSCNYRICCSHGIFWIGAVRASGDLPLPTTVSHGPQRWRPACQQPSVCVASRYGRSTWVMALCFLPLEPVVPGALVVVSICSLTCPTAALPAYVLVGGGGGPTRGMIRTVWGPSTSVLPLRLTRSSRCHSVCLARAVLRGAGMCRRWRCAAGRSGSFSGVRPPLPPASRGRVPGGTYRWMCFLDELVVGTGALVDHQWCVAGTGTEGAPASGRLWHCALICARECARVRRKELSRGSIRSARRASREWIDPSTNSPTHSIALCHSSPLYHPTVGLARPCSPPPLHDGVFLERGACVSLLVLPADVLLTTSSQSPHGGRAPGQGPLDAAAWLARRSSRLAGCAGSCAA